VNSVSIIGRLCNDPELKYTPSGHAVVTFSVAVQKRFKDQQTGKYEADFFTVVAWR